MLFLQISTHPPESCPMHNAKAMKAYKDIMAKPDSYWMKKYRVKMIGGWVAIPEHTQVMVWDAPNMEALMKAGTEPEMMAWFGYNTSQIMPVMTIEESAKLFMK
jgi:Domain of unknown function (DUF3303)